MRKLIISTGRSRHDTRWKQREVTWEKMLEKLSKTHRTVETEAEYHLSPKDRQGEIKDVGGFVGGAVEGGKRKKGAVQTRSMLTLDIDYGKKGVWDDIEMLFDCAMAVYSTHSHTKKKPRLRLIIPLSRDVNPEEYEALGRAVANIIGIDMFDDTTYQAERLMFWPSTPKDGEYVYKHQDGEFMDPDAELAHSYRDWRDSSQWPVSSRQVDLVRRSVKQQADPLLKQGSVGRFCRAYDIHEAIATFLPEIYEATDLDPNRYTYLQGSTAGGMIVYEDKFAYSHHGTDPAGGQLCNAFDLVRVHLFGDMDDNYRGEDTTKKPSYLRMEELVSHDDKVREQEDQELRDRLENDFGGITITDTEEPKKKKAKKVKASKPDTAPEDEEEDLASLLDRDKKGTIKNNTFNVMTILAHHKALKGNLCHDDMSRVIILKKDLPWRRITPEAGGYFWGNDDDAQLQVWLELTFGITGKEKILNARSTIAQQNHFHPVRDYLNSLTWDGEKRLDTMFIDYLGATDTELTRDVTRKCMVAAVARVMTPGCKYDSITVLQGPEGIGKSTLLEKLGGLWFNDSITDMAGGKGMEQIQGAWIIEAAELQAVKRNEVEAVKAFVSSRVDTFRPAYGRTKEVMPRQCVFFSTTNETEFLRGNTGNRRFWILQCTLNAVKDVWDMTEYDRGQLWAEAVVRFREGESLYLTKDREREMRQLQEKVNEINNDPRLGMIEAYLNKPLPFDWDGMDTNQRIVYLADDDEMEQRGVNRREYVCLAEILCECLREKIDDKSKYKSMEISALMAKIPGWERMAKARRFPVYGVQKGYRRVE